jgi:hypothetical protein
VWQRITDHPYTQASLAAPCQQVKQLKYTVRFAAALPTLVDDQRLALVVGCKVFKEGFT